MLCPMEAYCVRCPNSAQGFFFLNKLSSSYKIEKKKRKKRKEARPGTRGVRGALPGYLGAGPRPARRAALAVGGTHGHPGAGPAVPGWRIFTGKWSMLVGLQM